jgi:predicted RNase H-like HicB family nuclease
MDPKKYLVILEHAEGSNFSAYVPDLPGCVATGETRQECLQNIREAISMHIDGMREDGLPIPEPSSEADYVDAAATKRRRGLARTKLVAIAACIVLLACAIETVILVNYNREQGPHSMNLRVRVLSLSSGADIYKMSATANRYYPGQDPESMGALISGTSPEKYPNCQNAGSALLARCLFTDPNGMFPASNFGQFDRSMLGTVAGVPNTLIDNRNPPMAILYFPARKDPKTGAMRFFAADNARYLNADNCPQDANKVLAKWNVPSGVVYLIVAAGPSGKYFELDSVTSLEK